jgi:hypothetical protein
MNQLTYSRVTKITLISYKGIHLWIPEERNKPPSVANSLSLFWNPTNPSKVHVSLYPPEVFYFYFSPTCPPGVLLLFQRGGAHKTGLEEVGG